MKSSFLKSYGFSILLLLSILIGAVLGVVFKKDAVLFKPFGDIFINLLFTATVPVVFFSISSAVAGMPDIKRLGRILGWMLVIFVATGLIASIVMVIAVTAFPPAVGLKLNLQAAASLEPFKTSEEIVRAFAVPDFIEILAKKNMLALILFSLLVGLAASGAGEKGKAFRLFLASAFEVMMKVIAYIMFYAPVGLCAYFAYLVGVFGPDLRGVLREGRHDLLPRGNPVFFHGFHRLCLDRGRRPGRADLLGQHCSSFPDGPGHGKQRGDDSFQPRSGR